MSGCIQVVICRECSASLGVLDVERLVKVANQAEMVGSVAAVDRVCDKGTIAAIVEDAKIKEVDRVLVVPCSRQEISPALFQAYIKRGKINQFLIETVDLMNEVVLPHRDEPEKARTKADERLKAAIVRMGLLEPLETDSDDMRTKNVVIIGAGASGLEAARAAEANGAHTILLEKTDKPVKAPGIVLPIAKVLSIKGYGGNYTLSIEVGEKREELECAAIVVASGGDWSEVKGPLTKDYKDAMPLYRLRESVDSGKMPEGTVVIVDTPDPKAASGGAQDCAWEEALTLALDIRKTSVDKKVYLVFQEMRASGMSELVYRDAAEAGVKFIRYDKKRPPRVRDGKMTVDDLAQGETLAVGFGTLAYASVHPNPDNLAIANSLRIPISAHGGVRRGSMQRGPVTTPRQGIYVCGSAMFPKTEDMAVAEGRAAGALAAQYAVKGVVEFGGSVAVVEQEKCSACLTCVRTCPYEAPFIGTAGKAEIRTQQCQGCGMCVGVCPSKAIELRNYTDEQLFGEMSAYLGGEQ